jgi:hypothetical protein
MVGDHDVTTTELSVVGCFPNPHVRHCACHGTQPLMGALVMYQHIANTDCCGAMAVLARCAVPCCVLSGSSVCAVESEETTAAQVFISLQTAGYPVGHKLSSKSASAQLGSCCLHWISNCWPLDQVPVWIALEPMVQCEVICPLVPCHEGARYTTSFCP